MNIVDAILIIENDNANYDEYIAAGQFLIDTDMVWTLQGFYGRTAQNLIEAGHCKPRRTEDPYSC